MSHTILNMPPRLRPIRTQLNPIIRIKPTPLQRPTLHAPYIPLVQIPPELADLLLHEDDLRAPLQGPVAVLLATLDVGRFMLVVVHVQVFYRGFGIEAAEDGVGPVLPSRPFGVVAVDLGGRRGGGLVGRGLRWGRVGVGHLEGKDCEWQWSMMEVGIYGVGEMRIAAFCIRQAWQALPL